MKNILKNWKTTGAGLTAIILILLVNSGKITADQSTELGRLVNGILDNIDSIIGVCVAAGLILSKDADVTELKDKQAGV